MTELEYRAAPLDANAARPISRRTFISAADLRLNPAWDRVRPLPRFTALLARLEKDARFAPQNAVSEPAALTK
ncbi:MAG: hypothetical protein H7232_04450 [Aeromicrobium sp.]|nr:hypothetical protein [Burkholderiales bacterium]